MKKRKLITFKDIPGLTAFPTYTNSYYIFDDKKRLAIYSKDKSTAWIYKVAKVGMTKNLTQKFYSLKQAMRWVFIMTQTQS